MLFAAKGPLANTTPNGTMERVRRYAEALHFFKVDILANMGNIATHTYVYIYPIVCSHATPDNEKTRQYNMEARCKYAAASLIGKLCVA